MSLLQITEVNVRQKKDVDRNLFWRWFVLHLLSCQRGVSSGEYWKWNQQRNFARRPAARSASQHARARAWGICPLTLEASGSFFILSETIFVGRIVRCHVECDYHLLGVSCADFAGL
jgi:hypothetical protein